ncbi:MAG: hypothetical protein NVSMB56_13930 [Pyrinomonadaceae bacterium]
MGSNEAKDSYHEYPQHEETVESFYIDRTEVSNGEYAEFIMKEQYPMPNLPEWSRWKKSDNKFLNGEDRLPVRMVSQLDANAFADWRTRTRLDKQYSLPTEVEWEYVARSGGNSTDGVADSIGRTVQEWTQSPFIPYRNSKFQLGPNEKDKFVFRGLAKNNADVLENATIRTYAGAAYKDAKLGFRLIAR